MYRPGTLQGAAKRIFVRRETSSKTSRRMLKAAGSRPSRGHDKSRRGWSRGISKTCIVGAGGRR